MSTPYAAAPERGAPRGITFTRRNPVLVRTGVKTQTRRIIKPQPGLSCPYRACCIDESHCRTWRALDDNDDRIWTSPYGLPGDDMYVSEAIEINARADMPDGSPGHLIRYLADDEQRIVPHLPRCKVPPLGRYRGRRIPREWSRTLLRIGAIWMERVNDINHKDALAEGVAYDVSKPDGAPLPRFRALWDSIHGDGSFDSGVWTWVVTFHPAPAAPGTATGGGTTSP